MHSAGRRAELSGAILDTRILIIGINYSPEQTGIAPYTTGMAEYLAAKGARVRVLTGVPHYPQWRVEARYTRRMASREYLRGVDVIRLRHFVPHRMTGLRRAAYEASFLAHAGLRGVAEHPDLVLACTPALGGAVAAATVARRVRCPLVVVVQDLVARATEESGIRGGVRLSRVAGRLEGRALRSATSVVVTSEGFRRAVEEYGVAPARITTLRNWTHITPTTMGPTEARTRLGWPVGGFLAVHTGNMGFKQDLGNVIEAARALEGTAVNIVLVGTGSQREALQLQGKGLSNVRFVDLVSSDLYPTVLAAADVVLVNERPTVREMSMPSKITSYLAAGRPVVGAVANRGTTHTELRATGGAAYTVPAGRPDLLAAALSELVGETRELRAMSEAGRAFAAANLSPAGALDALLNVIRGALAGTGRPLQLSSLHEGADIPGQSDG